MRDSSRIQSHPTERLRIDHRQETTERRFNSANSLSREANDDDARIRIRRVRRDIGEVEVEGNQCPVFVPANMEDAVVLGAAHGFLDHGGRIMTCSLQQNLPRRRGMFSSSLKSIQLDGDISLSR